jgi:DNA-binding CsgD family transcriptional regulator
MRANRRNQVKTPPIHSDDGVVLLDISSMQPIALDRGAAVLFTDPDQPRGGVARACSVPEEITKAIRSVKPSDLSALRTQLRIGADRYVCRAYWMEYPDGNPARSMIALYLHKNSHAGDAVDELAAEYDLTHREQEALLGISMGLTCKEVAERMNISHNTVKAYLRLIMVKMGVARRAGIMGKLLEHTANGNNGHGAPKVNGVRNGLRNGSSHP